MKSTCPLIHSSGDLPRRLLHPRPHQLDWQWHQMLASLLYPTKIHQKELQIPSNNSVEKSQFNYKTLHLHKIEAGKISAYTTNRKWNAYAAPTYQNQPLYPQCRGKVCIHSTLPALSRPHDYTVILLLLLFIPSQSIQCSFSHKVSVKASLHAKIFHTSIFRNNCSNIQILICNISLSKTPLNP